MVRAEKAAIGRVFGELWGLEGVGCTAVSTAAFGLFTFRLSHDYVVLKGGRVDDVSRVKAARLGRKKGQS